MGAEKVCLEYKKYVSSYKRCTLKCCDLVDRIIEDQITKQIYEGKINELREN